MAKYDYGDSVFYAELDEEGNMTKTYASVIWVTQVETEADSKHFNKPIGAVLYNIEFDDGSMKEFIPEDKLEPYTEDINNE